MYNSTLCYITRGNDVLMLHRVKKKNEKTKQKAYLMPISCTISLFFLFCCQTT